MIGCDVRRRAFYAGQSTQTTQDPACTVYAGSHAEHLLQLYAGLYALHAAGLIQIKQRFGPDELRRRLGRTGLNDAGFYQDIVEHVALYAKRSFRRTAYGSNQEKFVPLGLNYAVYLDRTTYPELRKSLRQFDLSGLAAKQLFISLARYSLRSAGCSACPRWGFFVHRRATPLASEGDISGEGLGLGRNPRAGGGEPGNE
jgi:hypothetical protein